MPSPISSTRPTSRTSIWDWYCLISSLKTETISSALNLMAASRENVVADLVELGPYGRVVHHVADTDDQAAEQLGIDGGFQNGVHVEEVAQPLLQPLPLVVGQGHRRADRDAQDVV